VTYIYGDIIIIQNIIINYTILWLTAYFSKFKTNKVKIILASFTGACYAILIYFPLLNFLNNLSMKLCLSVLMIFIVFTPFKIKVFLKSLAIFYLISFIFGGIGFALICMTNTRGIVSKGIFHLYDFPLGLFFLTCILGFFIIKYSWDLIRKKGLNKSIITVLNIFIDGNQVEILTLFDTANFLYEPISKLPVIIVEYDFVKEILPLDIKKVFIDNLERDFNLISEIIKESEWLQRFRIIPFSSIGEQNGLLIGFKTDRITYFYKKEKKEIDNVIMAIYKNHLSEDGEYNALIHPEVLNYNL